MSVRDARHPEATISKPEVMEGRRRRRRFHQVLLSILLGLLVLPEGVQPFGIGKRSKQAREVESCAAEPVPAPPAPTDTPEIVSVAEKAEVPAIDDKGKQEVDDAAKDEGTINALTTEIAELEVLIRLQTQKLNALTALRRRYQAGERPAPGLMRNVLDGPWDHQLAPEPRLPGAIYPTSPSLNHDDYLITRGKVNFTEVGGTIVRLLTFQNVREGPKTYKHPKSNQLVYKMVSMVAVGDARGHLHIYDLSGDKAAEYDTGHGAPLTTLSFEGLDDPLLVTGAEDGSLRVHNVSLWRHDAMVAGRRPRITRASLTDSAGEQGSGSVEAVKAVYMKPPERKTASGYAVLISPEATLEQAEDKAAAPSASLVYRHRSLGRVVVSGDMEGSIRFHARNGTLIKTLHTNHPIYDMQKNSFLIGYTANQDINFFGTFSMEPVPAACHGRHGPLRSLAFDILVPSVVHASTSTGDILIFDTRDRLLEDKTAFPLVRKMSSSNGLPSSLATVRGYLLSASSAGITVYNATGLRDSPGTVHQSFHVPLPSSSSPPHFAASFCKITSELPAAFAISLTPSDSAAGSVELHLMESLLPYTRPKPVDFLWMRGPLMMLVVVCIFAWQFSRAKARRNSAVSGGNYDGPASFAGRGRFDDLGDRDLDFIKSSLEGLRKEMGSTNGPGAAPFMSGRKGPRSTSYGERDWD